MAKLYSERLKKDQEEEELVLPDGSIRLRFNRTDPLFKPHFRGILTRQSEDVIAVDADVAAEGDFRVVKVTGDGQLEGEFTMDEDLTPETGVAGVVDYEVTVSADHADGSQATVTKVQPVMPALLSESDLITAEGEQQKTYPWAKTVGIASGLTSGQFVAMEKSAFSVTEFHKNRDVNLDLLSWIVYKGHDHTMPILKFYDHEAPLEIDFSDLPAGKYRVEAFGKYSRWHAEKGRNRFGRRVGEKAKTERYAFLDIESTPNRLGKITSPALEKGGRISWGEQVSFSTGALFEEKGMLDGLSWQLTNAEGTLVMTEITAGAAGKDTITLEFPQPGAQKVQEYRLVATTSGGLTTERTVQVHFLKRKTAANLTQDPAPEDGRKPPYAKSIEVVDAKFHVGTQVALRPVTFTVGTWGRKTNPDLLSWIVFEGHSLDYPIIYQSNAGKDFTVDFSKLPEGKYRVEALGTYGKWHVEKDGHDRFGNVLEDIEAKKKEKFSFLDVESMPNALKGAGSADLVQNAQMNKLETNWGVEVQFTADLRFDLPEEIAKLEWELRDAEGDTVMQAETAAAKGKAAVVFTFPQPKAKTDYTLTLKLGETTQTQAFTVVPKAFVTAIELESSVERYVYNDERDLQFRVMGFTQKKANQTDLDNVKWVRIFFEGLRYEDYDAQSIRLDLSDGKVNSATMGGHEAAGIEHTGGVVEWQVSAGLPDNGGGYRSGLYLVEAYTGKPDGRSSGNFADMIYYEVARNEVTGITGPKYIRPSGGAERFTYKVESWLFKEQHGESKNVKWALYDADQQVAGPVQAGVELPFYHEEEGEFTLKAWVADKTAAASFPVTIEKAELLEAYFTDSSGKKIDRSGMDDTVHVYMKTTGLQGETVQVSLWEYDSVSGDDFLQSVDAEVNDAGILFPPVSLKKENLVTYGGKTDPAQIYLSITTTKNDPIKLDNIKFTRDRIHYYLSTDPVLTTVNKVRAYDYDFLGADGKVLQTVALYGATVRVRVRVSNLHGTRVHIAVMEFGKGIPLALEASYTPVVIDEEGYATMEFTIPESAVDQHPPKATDVRYFYPALVYEDKKSSYVEGAGDKAKMLKVAKEMPSKKGLEGLDWDEPEYAPLPTSTEGFLLTLEDLIGIKIIPDSKIDRTTAILPFLNQFLEEFEVNTTPVRLAHFLGQVAKETGFWNFSEGFNYTSEALKSTFGNFKSTTGKAKADLWGRPSRNSPAVTSENQIRIANWAYGIGAKASELGNTAVSDANMGSESGHGYKYRGRGLIQLTGKSNYEKFQEWYDEIRSRLGLPAANFVADPDKLLEDRYVVLSAIFFWDSHGMAKKADQGVTKTDSYKVTNIVNSGEADEKKELRWEYTRKAYEQIFDDRWKVDSESSWVNPLAEMNLRGHYNSGWHPDWSIYGKVTGRTAGKHDGVDIYAPEETEIFAVLDGKVYTVGTWGGYGKTILLEADYEGTTMYFQYSHLSAYDVKKNDQVKAGDVIGKTGATGNAASKFPHLHFEVYSSYPSPKVRENPIAAIPEIALTLNVWPNEESQKVF